jgi:hypothetical protein
MNKILPVSINLLIGSLSYAVSSQTIFQKTFGGASSDIGYSVQQTADEGYIIAGYTLSFGRGSRDVYLLRTDSSGNTLWTKTYGSNNIDYAWTVQQTADGGYIIGAHSGSFGAGSHDVYLIKCDMAGNVLWTRAYGGSSADGAYSLQQTSDGGYIVAAHTSSFGAGQHDVYLIKTDVNGDTVWTRTYGGSGGDYLRSVQQTLDEGYISVSETFSFGAGGADIYLVKVDQIGNLLWAKTYGGSSSDYGYSVRQTTDSGYIIGGYTASFGAGQFDMYLVKTDADGAVLWAKTYGGALSDFGYSVEETNDGGYIIAGFTQSFGVGGDVYLVRTDSSGVLLWSKNYGGASSDYGWSVQQTNDGGFVVSGYSASFGAGGNDVYLIKTDEFGNSGCNESNPGTITGTALSTIVASTQTMIGSGAFINATSTFMDDPVTFDEFLCESDACCNGRVGDANGMGGDEPSIGDVAVMIDAKFINLTCDELIDCLEEADVNQSGGTGPACDDITISDISTLIDYLFITGPTLGLPDCL